MAIMAMKVVLVACALFTTAVASDSCAAGGNTCTDDVTSLIQQSVQHHSAPAPAAKGSDADTINADQTSVYKVQELQWSAMRKQQLLDMQARQKQDNGCKYGPMTKDGTCPTAFDNTNSVFSGNMGVEVKGAAAKKLLLLQGDSESLYPMVIPFTKEDHDLIPLHRRLKWERQRRGRDPHTLHSLVTVTDSTGNTVTPKDHEEMSLAEEQFPLAVTMHAPPAAGCPASSGPTQGEKPKSGEGFNIDISKMMQCQSVHAEQVLKDMEGQEKSVAATYKKATDAYTADIKKLKAEQDKAAKALNDEATKDHSEIEAKYPCGFGAKAGAFFGKVFGKDTKQADECIAKRKLAVQDADKKGKAAMDKMIAAEQVKKDAVQKTMDDAKDENEKFKKTLRDAKTQKFMLPIVAAMTSDKVMSKLQKVDNFMQKPGEPDAGPDAANAAIQNEATTKGLNGINDPDAKEFYVKQKLSAVIVPFYNEAVSVAQAAMWNVLDFIKSVAQTSLMSLVGAIPFVGGVLSAIVAIVFDAIWVMFEHHVNAAFLNLANVVIDKVLDAMVKPICAELKDTKGPIKTVKAADKKTLASTQTSAQGSVTGPAQKNLEAEAKKAAANAGGAKTSTSDFVKSMASSAKSDKDDQDKLEQSKYAASASLLQIQADFEKHPLFQEHRILTTHPLYKDL